MGKITARINQPAEARNRQYGRQHINFRTADVTQIDRQIFAHQHHRRQHKRRGKAEQRQCVWSMMMPDKVGPIAGAAVNIMVMTPIAVPRLLGGKIDNTPLNRSGTKNAADTACTIRPTTNTPKVGANAQISEPAKNVACVNSTILRVSNH